MRRVFAILTLFVYPAVIFAADQIAVVARFVSVSELPDPCNGRDDCIVMDSLYQAKYDVLQVVRGVPKASTLTFTVADHYGFPDFARYKEALLIINQDENGSWLEKYQGYPVYQTRKGNWAYCGDPYDEEIPKNARKYVDLISELDAVFADVSVLNSVAVKEEYDPDMYEVIKDKVYCRKGVYVDELLRLKKPELYEKMASDRR